MRHSFIPFIIIAGIALFSCARVSEIEQPTEAQKGTYTYTLSAGSQDTKTSYDAEGHFSWTAGDAISVLFHNGETNKFFTLTTSNSGALASFTGEIEGGYEIGASTGNKFDKKIWALFPASDYHTYTAANDSVSFYVQPEVDFTTRASANIPMYDLVATEGEELYFKSLTGNYKFILKVKDQRINKVKAVVYNQQTYGLSGNWPVKVSDKTYINYGYADPGSEKSTLTYTCNVNHVDSLAEFYVSSCYWGKFQPSISIFDAERNYLLTELNATKIDTAKYLNKVQPITIAVNALTYIPAIDIDGVFDDWNSVSHVIPTTSNRIVEWKYTQDTYNLYFLYKINAEKLNKAETLYKDGNYIYIGFDTDNNITKGDSGENGGAGAGLEARAIIYPWTGNKSGDPVYTNGKDSNSEIRCPVSGASQGHLNVATDLIDSYYYVEVSVPLSYIGNPTDSITVNHAMNYHATGRKRIRPEIATIIAGDQEVDAGKTVSIGATTNSTASLSYSSNDTEVATVDENGIITGVAEGTATITISTAAVAGEYDAASKSITVTVNSPFTPAISIDGDMDDWESYSEMASETINRIKSWKFTSDERYVYFYFKLRKNKSDSSRFLRLGFDYDDSGSYDDTYHMTGLEIVVECAPFTNESGKAPVCFNDTVTNAKINGTSDASAVKAYMYDEGESLDSDNSVIYLEVSVLRKRLPNLPASGVEFNIGASYEQFLTGFQKLSLE